MRDCRLAVVTNTHLAAIDRMPSDRRIDGAATGQNAAADSQVVSRDFPVGQRPNQRRMCFECLADQQQAARILIQAMHDAGPGQFVKRRNVVQETIHQGTAGIACSWMGDGVV